MSRDHFLRLLDLHAAAAAEDDPFFPFPTSSSSSFSSCPFSTTSSAAHHHRFLLDDHPTCPLGFTSPSPIDTFHLDLDLHLHLLLPPRAELCELLACCCEAHSQAHSYARSVGNAMLFFLIVRISVDFGFDFVVTIWWGQNK
jgi:hypothetical protein